MPKKKLANPLVKLLQRVNPVGTTASIRYDTNNNQWATLDKDNRAKQHFETAIMENVSFRSCQVKEYVGCSGSRTTWIGIADGELFLHRHAGQLEGAQNLHYREGKFLDVHGVELRSVSKLAVLPSRRAIYWA
jgi:hypothetical protein